MQDYFIKKYQLYDVEFLRDYINSKDIWYSLVVTRGDESIRCKMHNNNNRIWKITGSRISPLLLRLQEDFNEAIGKNEVYN